jgi:hypothetical protein
VLTSLTYRIPAADPDDTGPQRRFFTLYWPDGRYRTIDCEHLQVTAEGAVLLAYWAGPDELPWAFEVDEVIPPGWRNLCETSESRRAENH